MAIPNFRLFETQARWSVYLSLLAWLGLAALAVATFKNFHWETRNIFYDPASTGLSRYRQPAVLGMSAVVVLLGVFAGGFGYNSLGEKRNTRQGASWAGMLLGALVTTLAILDFIAWQMLSQAVSR